MAEEIQEYTFTHKNEFKLSLDLNIVVDRMTSNNVILPEDQKEILLHEVAFDLQEAFEQIINNLPEYMIATNEEGLYYACRAKLDIDTITCDNKENE